MNLYQYLLNYYLEKVEKLAEYTITNIVTRQVELYMLKRMVTHKKQELIMKET